MMQRMLLPLRLAAILTLANAAAAGAQNARANAAIVEAALWYRERALGDTTSLDACSLWTKSGSPPVLSALMDERHARRLVAHREGCGTVAVAAYDPWRPLVVLERVTSDSVTARVVLQVNRGEYFHSEDFELRRDNRTASWHVVQVRLSGVSQVHLVSPRRPQ